MDLICTKPFRNVAFRNFGRIEVPGALHEDHVHKGALFSIGNGKTLEAMKKTERPAAELVSALFIAKCVAEPTPEAIARVEAEIEVDRKREARAKQMDASAALTAAGAQFADLIAQARRLAPAAAPARAR